MAKILFNLLLWYRNDRLSCLTAETILKLYLTSTLLKKLSAKMKAVLHNNCIGTERVELKQDDQKPLHNIKDIHLMLLGM